jgi:hypothetical protein
MDLATAVQYRSNFLLSTTVYASGLLPPHRYLRVGAWELVHGAATRWQATCALSKSSYSGCTAMASFSLSQPGPTTMTPETKLGFEATPTAGSIANAWSIESRERYAKEATTVGIKGRLSSNPYLAPSMEAGVTDLQAMSSSSPQIQHRLFGSSSPWLLSSGSSGDDIPRQQQRQLVGLVGLRRR